MNIFTATGNLGQEPETRFTQSGTGVTSFSVAVKSGWGDNQKTTWVNCNLWGKKGNNQPHPMAEYLAKGMKVTFSGEIFLEEWEGQDGTKQKTLKCTVRDIELPPKAEGQQQSAPAQEPAQQRQPAQQTGEFGDFDDDIPFSNYEYRTLA